MAFIQVISGKPSHALGNFANFRDLLKEMLSFWSLHTKLHEGSCRKIFYEIGFEQHRLLSTGKMFGKCNMMKHSQRVKILLGKENINCFRKKICSPLVWPCSIHTFAWSFGCCTNQWGVSRWEELLQCFFPHNSQSYYNAYHLLLDKCLSLTQLKEQNSKNDEINERALGIKYWLTRRSTSRAS